MLTPTSCPEAKRVGVAASLLADTFVCCRREVSPAMGELIKLFPLSHPPISGLRMAGLSLGSSLGPLS